MSINTEVEYLSAGGNRHSAAADWSTKSRILAYGADHNVALWKPLDENQHGVFALLGGHNAKVNAVRFLQHEPQTGVDEELLVSGDANGEVAVRATQTAAGEWTSQYKVKAHDAAINCIASLGHGKFIVTGAADAKIKLWRASTTSLTPLATINTTPRFIPLTLALGQFQGASPDAGLFLAAAGTRNDISVYSISKSGIEGDMQTQLCATLTGHEGWIRSLALRKEDNGDYLLASASADKYVRLWKFSQDDTLAQKTTMNSADVAIMRNTLTAKVQKVSVGLSSYAIMFEALLLGHEDWVYATAWHPDTSVPQLLTASADGTLTIWEPDQSSGVWLSTVRLGEISGQKGATTATGSTGGFWNALWSPDGQAISCLGRTGSWRLWRFDNSLQYWMQKPGVSGHVNSVEGICWSPDGSYLLSTGSDQTTRLHAEWRRGTKRTWHEFARPQIHGYDLNCITCINKNQFSTGADEKLLRVFDKPKTVAKMLQKLCGADEDANETLPDTAAIPVLGLSNKAMAETNGHVDDDGEHAFVDEARNGTGPLLEYLDEPPTEDLLARHTLWPEREKLYGHGYEISEAAAGDNVLATACKASSLDHAVIRLYDTSTWHEIKPPLTSHSLTVTRLAWSTGQMQYLLSTGRDRQWTVFRNDEEKRTYEIVQSVPKAHTRMILDAAWGPAESKSAWLMFATAGRDKSVKVWHSTGTIAPYFQSPIVITRKSAVTAVAFTPVVVESFVALVTGEEDGTLALHILEMSNPPTLKQTIDIENLVCPSKSITRMAWRPETTRLDDEGSHVLAISSADSSVRILRIDLRSFMQDLT